VICIDSKRVWKQKILLSVSLVVGCFTAALAADTITGVARNQTHGQLATGDEVILLRLDLGIPKEECRTKINAQGSFTLKVLYPDKSYLVRVLHEGVNYDQQASAGDTVSINVFDAATKVQGVTGNIEIIRIGTNGNLLHVSDMVEIKNDSNPPLTQASERTFEVYIPAHAKIDSVLAAASEKIGMMISATPVPGKSEYYTVNFPLRPGSTKFAFNYDLPYDGHATFQTKSVYPLHLLAVMIPQTMKFTSRFSAFQVLRTGNSTYKVEAANQVEVGERPRFEISGFGTPPASRAQVQSALRPPVVALSAPVSSAPQHIPARAQGANVSGATSAYGLAAPSSPLRWWPLVVGVVPLLGTCGLLLWRRYRLPSTAAGIQKTGQQERTSVPRVESLKEELFQLEIGRLQGTVSGEEYASAKEALEGTVRWAVARIGSGEDSSPQ